MTKCMFVDNLGTWKYNICAIVRNVGVGLKLLSLLSLISVCTITNVQFCLR